MLSRAAELALAALPLLDPRGPSGPGRHVRQLADQIHAPAPFLAKVLQELAAKGILRGKRGRAGGFVLGRPAAEISLADIVLALEGKESLEDVYRPLEGPAGARMEPLRQQLVELLSLTTVESLPNANAKANTKVSSSKRPASGSEPSAGGRRIRS